MAALIAIGHILMQYTQLRAGLSTAWLVAVTDPETATAAEVAEDGTSVRQQLRANLVAEHACR